MVVPFIEDPETRAHMQTIIAEENRHISRLKGFIAKGERTAVPAL
jgi:rubrerythrin